MRFVAVKNTSPFAFSFHFHSVQFVTLLVTDSDCADGPQRLLLRHVLPRLDDPTREDQNGVRDRPQLFAGKYAATIDQPRTAPG